MISIYFIKTEEDLDCSNLCQFVSHVSIGPVGCCQAPLTPPLVATCCNEAAMYVCVRQCVIRREFVKMSVCV